MRKLYVLCYANSLDLKQSFNITKYRKAISWTIKIAIVLAAFWFVHKEVFAKQHIIENFKEMLDKPLEIRLLILTIALTFVNWGFESLKWKSLIDKIEKISFLTAYKAILSGVTVSIFTPNRVGEYAGRIFHLEKADRINAVLITMVCGVAQLLVTIFAGIIALSFFAPTNLDIEKHISMYYYYALLVIFIGGAGFLLFAYLNASLMAPVIKRMRILGKWRRYGKLFGRFEKKELSKVLLYSFGRFIVFTLQFYLLLLIFGITIPYFPAIMMISITYFVMAIIPTIAIAELGIRGVVSVYLISLVTPIPNELGILTASFALWLVNLAFPALLGSLFIFNLKFFRQNGA